MRFGFQAMTVVSCFLLCLGAQTLPKFMGRQVTIIEPNHTKDGFPKGPAMLCLDGPPRRQCYTAPKDYGNNPTVTPVQLGKDQPALLFSVETGGVSGWSVHYVLLDADLEDFLGEDVTVSNQNEHGFWNEPMISDQKIFLTANYVWGPDEGHYGPHRWIISAYFPKASGDDGRYRLQDRYMTVRHYDLESQDVLAAEKPEILARLRRIKSAR
jgi:hypothetical protein